jgi:predicted metallopeptidase
MNYQSFFLKRTTPQQKRTTFTWEEAVEIKKDIEHILSFVDMPYIESDRIFCFRSYGAKARAYARIWTFPKIFQKALDIKPAYVIEVLSHHFDKLSPDEQKKVLIHELLHIPKNFSGALLPHKSRGRLLEKTADVLYKQYQQKKIL